MEYKEKYLLLSKQHVREIVEYQSIIESLLNKVNRVTSAYRHSETTRRQDLVALCNRQLEVEKRLEEIT